MNIVVLDGYTLNPGDLSWDPLLALGNCVIYDRTDVGEVLLKASGAEILLTNKTPITKQTIAAIPSLRYIGVLATGYNIVDVLAAHERNIPVTNVPTYGTDSVAQMVFAHLLNLTQGVGPHAQTVREGRWSVSKDFCYWDVPLVELQGLTMGIVGFGRIGQAVARLAEAFGMFVIASDRPGTTPPEGVSARFVALNDLFRLSDVVSLHCPLTLETRHLVNKERLALMKRTAFLINTSRGQLVDEHALACALDAGALGGAGLDVLDVEPPLRENPLLSARTCYITPHIAWATTAARRRLLATAAENIAAFLAGRLQNRVG
jgi:glycerate dehydrogenase